MSSPWASYQIRKIAGCACAGNAGNVFPRRRFQRKPIVGDHGTCVMHVPWCMSGSLTCGDGENVPGIPGACAPAILRIWQEAHEQVQIKPDCRHRRSHMGTSCYSTSVHASFPRPNFGPLGQKKTYRKVSNIRRTLVGNKIVDHSDVVGASPVGAAPTISSFST